MSPKHRACRQYCHAQKLGVSSTPNASLHYNLLLSAPAQTHLASPSQQSPAALLPMVMKYTLKRKSRLHRSISSHFLCNAHEHCFHGDPRPSSAWLFPLHTKSQISKLFSHAPASKFPGLFTWLPAPIFATSVRVRNFRTQI